MIGPIQKKQTDQEAMSAAIEIGRQWLNSYTTAPAKFFLAGVLLGML